MENAKCENMPSSVLDFYNSIGGIGNVFHLYTENEDGEVTSEAFGKNVITDYGLKQIHSWDTYSDSNSNGMKIWIGTSTQKPAFADQSMYELACKDGATRYESGIGQMPKKNTRYPVRYIPDKHIFVENVAIAKEYFDYNIPDADGTTYTEAFDITEIGFGGKSTELISHALVYNKNGEVSSITKKPNEKLFITIYWQGVVSVDYIEDNWSKGIGTFISPHMLVYPFRGCWEWRVGYTARAKHVNRNDVSYNSYYDYSSSTNRMTDTVNNISKYNGTMKTPDKLYEQDRSYVSSVTCANSSTVFTVYTLYSDAYPTEQRHYDGYAHSDTDYALNNLMQKMIEQNEPEEFDVINVFTNSYQSNSFSDAIGRARMDHWYGDTNDRYFYYSFGMLPMTQADFKSVTRYNHSTKEWDIEENFVNKPDINYDTSSFSLACDIWLENTQNTGSGGTSYRVFCNMQYDNRHIVSFDNSGITVYATDTYWDISSYEIIPNLSNVPVELSNKRYYCVKINGYVTLYPNYTDGHQLITKTDTIDYPTLLTEYSVSSIDNGSAGCVSLTSEEYGWLLTSYMLVYPDAEGGPVTYFIRGPKNYEGTDYNFRYGRFATKDRILLGQDTYSKENTNGPTRYSSFTYRLYTVSDDPTIEPTYEDITLPFTTKGTNSSYYCLHSWSKDGYLCAQYTSQNETIIFNVYDTENFLKIPNSKWAHISGITNYIVYQCSDITNVTRFNVMNVDGEIIDTFELPDTQTYTVRGICGWKQHVYIEVSASSSGDICYYYNINTHVLQTISHFGAIRKDQTSNKPGAVLEEYSEEFYAILPSRNLNNLDCNTCFVTNENPTGFKQILPNSTWSSSKRYYATGGKIVPIDDGKNLIFIAKFSYNADYQLIVFDFGRRIDSGEIKEVPLNNFPRYTTSADFGIYKNKVYVSNVNEPQRLTFYPIERFLAHRVQGTTKTITAVNNPFRLSGIKCNWAVTNDIDKISDGNYDTSVNVVS